MQIGECYSRSHYAFNDEDNAAVVDYILALARVRVTMGLMPSEPTPQKESEPEAPPMRFAVISTAEEPL